MHIETTCPYCGNIIRSGTLVLPAGSAVHEYDPDEGEDKRDNPKDEAPREQGA